MSMNFPLFNNRIGLTKEDLYQYILLFPNHEMLFSKTTTPLHSYHRYRDGLMIKCTWTPIKDVSFLSSQKEQHSASIQELIEEEFIILKKARIFYFSDTNNVPSSQSFEIFQQLLQEKNRTLQSDEYERLEFPLYHSTITTKTSFEKLVQKNQNIINFNRFLEKREMKKNESL